MPNDIVFYVTDRGVFPVVEFLLGLASKEQAKCLSYMEVLIEHGNRLPSNYIKHVEDGIWELRPEFGGTEFRFFYFAVLDDTVIMLHAIKKKTSKTLRKDIEIALKRKKELQ